MFGVPLEQLCREEEKPQLLKSFGKFAETLDELMKAEDGGPWMLGKSEHSIC